LNTPTIYDLYDGSGQPPVPTVQLKAGPLTMEFDGADLRYIRCGNVEIVRRLYAAIRGETWLTAPNRVRCCTITKQDSGDGFLIDYCAVSQLGAVHVDWHAEIEGDADGNITFRFKGQARGDFNSNRIGLCVHHPLTLAGTRVDVEHNAGGCEALVFPESIAPHQPFFDVRSMRHSIVPGLSALITFEGDAFETEDQRNWGDASYKTYSTPLALPYPHHVKDGTIICQTIRLELIGKPIADAVVKDVDRRITFEITGNPQSEQRVPAIGLSIPARCSTLTGPQFSRLRALRPAHMRVEIDIDRDSFGSRLDLAALQAEMIGCPVAVAVHVGADYRHRFERLAEQARRHKACIASWAIYETLKPVTSKELFRTARETLGPVTPDALFGLGTSAYFAELNRNRPDLDLVDFVVYSANPQVHANDNLSLVETPPALGQTVRAARAFCGDLPVHVAPITLKPRPPLNAAYAQQAEEKYDPRQRSLIGAGWTLAAVRHLTEAGAACLTCFDTVGHGGVMDYANATSLSPDLTSTSPGVYPLYHLLAELCRIRDGRLLNAATNAPLKVDGIAVDMNDRQFALLCNLTCSRQTVTVSGLEGRTSIWILDAENATAAMRIPEQFRTRPGMPIGASRPGKATGGGTVTTDLAPFALAMFVTEIQ